MVETDNIREHSLFKHFYQAGEKLFITSSLLNASSAKEREVWPSSTEFLRKIYTATGSIPAVGTIINNVKSPAGIEVVKIYYSTYGEDVLITVQVKTTST